MEIFKRPSSGSRRVRGDPFAFGLGKRADPFAFWLGRRKRFYWKYNPFNFLKEEGAKRDPYAFGLGSNSIHLFPESQDCQKYSNHKPLNDIMVQVDFKNIL